MTTEETSEKVKPGDESEDFPDSNWTVEFMKFDLEGRGRPIVGTSWKWKGIAFNARTALEKALEAMIDAMPENAHHRRCVRLTMDDLPT